MRRIVIYPVVVVSAVAACLFATTTAAAAHGYVASPPSRQALCQQRLVPDCGRVVYEPQSVEGGEGGPLDLTTGGLRYSILE